MYEYVSYSVLRIRSYSVLGYGDIYRKRFGESTYRNAFVTALNINQSKTTYNYTE